MNQGLILFKIVKLLWKIVGLHVRNRKHKSPFNSRPLILITPITILNKLSKENGIARFPKPDFLPI